MKEAIAWFYTIDKKLWGDKIETNPYFATLSILFVALVGACSGAGRIFYEWFDWDVATNNVAMAYLFILIWGMNLCESIVASESTWIGLWRPLLMLLIFALVFAFGFIASVVVIFLVTAWVVLMLAGALLSGSGGGNSKKKRYSLNDGTEVEEESDGVYRDVSGSGRTFRDVGGGRVRED